MILTGDQESVRAESETLKSEYELLGTELDALDAAIAADREACSREDLERQEKTGRIGVLREQIRTEQMNEEHIRSRMASIDGEMHQKEEEQAEYESEKQALKCIGADDRSKTAGSGGSSPFDGRGGQPDGNLDRDGKSRDHGRSEPESGTCRPPSAL